MKGKTHIGMGLVTYLSIYNIIPGKFNFLGLFLVVFASILPGIMLKIDK